MDVIMPQLGETVAEGKVATWFKSVGDAVKPGDNLFEIETDKVTMEVQATSGGILSEIRVGAGETVPVGTVVAVVGEAGAAAPGSAKKAAPQAPGKAPAPIVAASPARPVPPSSSPPSATNGAAPTRALAPFDEVHTPEESFGAAATPQGLKITPLARRLIRQTGLDLAAIAQSVRDRGGWRIAASDVRNAPAPPAAPSEAPAIAARDGDAVETLTRIRAQTATRLAESWRSIPHAFQAVEIDFTRIDRARQGAKQGFAERHGVALTYLPFITRAVCLALAEFPRVNASFDKDRLILHREINLGIAVDLGHDGLIVPVLHNADEMNVGGLAKAMARQTEKARSGKLTLAEVSGGTYSISNNGSFGTLFTMPIINLPQVAILSTDAVRKRATVVETAEGEVILPRLVGMVGQSFDHRAFDGAYSASFLKRVKDIAETRDWMAEIT